MLSIPGAQIAAADCLLGKVGYGTTSECLAHGTPIVFVRRDYFNEEPFLRRLLQARDHPIHRAQPHRLFNFQMFCCASI